MTRTLRRIRGFFCKKSTSILSANRAGRLVAREKRAGVKPLKPPQTGPPGKKIAEITPKALFLLDPPAPHA
jgi:hypothetical protein